MTDNKPEAPAAWPLCTMLAYGTFGGGHPAARRYHVRTGVALALLVAGLFVVSIARSFFPREIVHILSAFAPGATLVYIAWEFRRYLLSIDELARRLQFESIVWTYLTGFALASILGGIGMLLDWKLNPIWFVALEPIRGIWLYVISRRY
jgi:hypothetical protein